MSYTYQNNPLVFWQHGNPSRNCGFGDYERTGDWSWEFYPFAYSWLAPLDSAPQPAPILPRGMGDGCGCGGSCGCKNGMGQATTGLFGTGLFSSSDPSQWGWGEWASIAVGVYFAGSLLGDVKSGGRRAGAAYRAAKRAS